MSSITGLRESIAQNEAGIAKLEAALLQSRRTKAQADGPVPQGECFLDQPLIEISQLSSQSTDRRFPQYSWISLLMVQNLILSSIYLN
jgi:hypothetical protein